jgi:hypothetical protein
MRHRRVTIAIAAVLVVLGIYVAYPYCLPDRVLMWETTKLASGNGRASTHRAQAAAKRYFESTNLIGKTRSEIVQLIGDPVTSNDSMYNFPFYPVAQGVMVYRFDTGCYGWQFNIHFEPSGKAIRVETLGIE